MKKVFLCSIAATIITAVIICVSPLQNLACADSSLIFHELSRSEILNAKPDDYSSPSKEIVHWNEYTMYKGAVHDGYIPASYLDDPVYCSMNLPSESQSDYMISIGRDNGHIIGDTSSSLAQKILSIGALYTTSGQTLPENFSVYIGPIKLFAYSASQQKWLEIDSQPYPTGIYVYTLPWTSTKSTQANVTYTNEYAKVDLTSQEMTGNVLHFWGKPVPLDKADYLYYACAYSFWVDKSVEGKLTATNGIDTKDISGRSTITQLYSSRGISASTTAKTIWGNTIPNSIYESCKSSVLSEMYKLNR